MNFFVRSYYQNPTRENVDGMGILLVYIDNQGNMNK